MKWLNMDENPQTEIEFNRQESTESHELIPVETRRIGDEGVQTVDARKLHEFLGSKQDFSTWIKDRIAQYGFVENQDFIVFHKIMENSAGGRPSIEYALALDMAKEISMVERNDQGKKARIYFIACERRAKQAAIDPMQALNDPVAMRGLLLTYSEKVITLQAENAALVPQAEALRRISLADGSLNLTETSKALQITRKKLIRDLSTTLRCIYRRQGNKNWLGRSEKVTQGWVEHKVGTYQLPDGSEAISEQVRLTPKGLARLALFYGREPDLALIGDAS